MQRAFDVIDALMGTAADFVGTALEFLDFLLGVL